MTDKISVQVTQARLQEIYGILDAETRPFEARVTAFRHGVCRMAVSAAEEDVEHFKKILHDNTEI